MSIIYSWAFKPLVIAEYEGLANVVRAVNWRYIGTDGVQSSEVYGLQDLPDPDPENFIQFDDVTTTIVRDWVLALLPEGSLANMQMQITDQIASLQMQPVPMDLME